MGRNSLRNLTQNNHKIKLLTLRKVGEQQEEPNHLQGKKEVQENQVMPQILGNQLPVQTANMDPEP